MRLALIIGELNGLSIMVGDIGNAYLEAKTKEKVYFIAGKEFGPLEGQTPIIFKALYSLHTSGACFHEKLANSLPDMDFKPTLSNPDLWYQDARECYKYKCVYKDALMAILKHPPAFFDLLTSKYNYILKGVRPPTYHLVGDFGQDPDGTLFWGSKRYIDKMLTNYEHMFGSLQKKCSFPLQKDDSHELDTSPELDKDGKKKYQSVIGALQWCITLGRFDISIAVMALSIFWVVPCQGHLECAQCIYGYLCKHPEGAIRFLMGIPSHEAKYSMPEHDWMYTVYGHFQK